MGMRLDVPVTTGMADDGQTTGDLPGRLVRGAQPAPS